MEEYYTDNLLPLLEGEDLENPESSDPDSSPPLSTPKERDLPTLRRSKRLQSLHQLLYVHQFEKRYPDEISLLRYCFQVEVEHPESGMNPADFILSKSNNINFLPQCPTLTAKRCTSIHLWYCWFWSWTQSVLYTFVTCWTWWIHVRWSDWCQNWKVPTSWFNWYQNWQVLIPFGTCTNWNLHLDTLTLWHHDVLDAGLAGQDELIA